MMSKSIIVCWLLLLTHSCIAQEMTIYAIPAPVKIDWSSPRNLLISALRNDIINDRYGKKHTCGHMIVELKNGDRYALVGMAPVTSSSVTRKVKYEGYGLGSFFTAFDGRMEQADVNLPQLEKRLRTGRLAFITMSMSNALFDRLWQYMTEYKERGYDKIYNGTNRPRYGEGAGCSAFAASFLEVAELSLNNVSANWSVSVSVPQKLIGGPEGNGRRVPLRDIFFCGSWASPANTSARHAFYYDPTLMYHWIKQVCNGRKQVEGAKKEKRQNAAGLAFDCTGAPVPSTPIWPHSLPVAKKD